MSRRLAIDPATPDDVAEDGGIAAAVKRAPRWGVGLDGTVDPASVYDSPVAISLVLLGESVAWALDGSLHPAEASRVICHKFPAADRHLPQMVLALLRGKVR